jgi:hypothetical protein
MPSSSHVNPSAPMTNSLENYGIAIIEPPPHEDQIPQLMLQVRNFINHHRLEVINF